jgi:hypothetical protein
MRAWTLLLALLTLLVGSVAGARPCATMALRGAAQRGELVGATFAMQTRPPTVGFVDSETLPLRVHWHHESAQAKAELTLELLEDAWAHQVGEMGYAAPLGDDGEGGSDRFDAYIGLVFPAGALTVAHDDVDDSDGRHASYSYILLDAGLDDDELPAFVHHEFAHVVQFATDLRASLMFAESSAVLAERLALPESESWAESLEDFQAFPNAPIFTDGIAWRPIAGEDGFYEFGAVLFLLYLEEVHGLRDGTLIRRLWQGGVQDDDVEVNEPDWLDALADEVDLPIDDLLLDFASWRGVIASWHVEGDGVYGGENLPGTALLRPLRLLPSSLDGAPLAIGRSQRPHQLGCLALETTALSQPIPVELQATSLPDDDGNTRPLGIAYLLGSPSEDRAVRGRHGSTGPELTLRLTVGARETLIVSVCDVGEADADDAPEDTDVQVTLRRTDVELPDAGPAPADAGQADAGPELPPPGCSCQASSRGSSGTGPFAAIKPYATVAMMVVGVLIFGLRYARVRRRRRLFKESKERADARSSR